MVKRCTNPKDKSYARYGGRGIVVCDEWLNNPASFFEWCDKSWLTQELRIDRIDNDGPYSPENCIPATVRENNQHRGNTHLFVMGGRTYRSSEAMKKFGVCASGSLYRRRLAGWSDEQILLTPSRLFKKIIDNNFGLHVLVDGFKADIDKLTDCAKLYDFLYSFPEQIGMTRIHGPSVIEYHGKNPVDWGVTGTVILAESLVAIHTFPDHDGFFTLDVYSCKCFSPYEVVQKVKAFFGMQEFDVNILPRGLNFHQRVFPTRDEMGHGAETIREFFPQK
jgi:S-adenosylmethionine decarboxylase